MSTVEDFIVSAASKIFGPIDKTKKNVQAVVNTVTYPKYNVYRKDSAIVMEFRLPGYSIENLNVVYDSKGLTVSADPGPKQDYIFEGFPIKSFTKTWPMCPGLAINSPAIYQNGILRVELCTDGDSSIPSSVIPIFHTE